mmetsp:Transcript_33951/g.74498  ORF Transcript_33951/g.74498 Transcript_33951/m.74498 type:complete len:265 (-) Transcript_33951:362-1156(-)
MRLFVGQVTDPQQLLAVGVVGDSRDGIGLAQDDDSAGDALVHGEHLDQLERRRRDVRRRAVGHVNDECRQPGALVALVRVGRAVQPRRRAHKRRQLLLQIGRARILPEPRHLQNLGVERANAQCVAQRKLHHALTSVQRVGHRETLACAARTKYNRVLTHSRVQVRAQLLVYHRPIHGDLPVSHLIPRLCKACLCRRGRWRRLLHYFRTANAIELDSSGDDSTHCCEGSHAKSSEERVDGLAKDAHCVALHYGSGPNCCAHVDG